MRWIPRFAPALAVALALGTAACVATGPVAHAQTEEAARARRAVEVLDEIMQMPEQAVPARLLADAHAIAVIPDVVKAGLVVGGRHGKGLISVRTAEGT